MSWWRAAIKLLLGVGFTIVILYLTAYVLVIALAIVVICLLGWALWALLSR